MAETGWTDERLREIVRHISDAAIELAFVRHDLTSDEVDVDDDADVKTRVEANEQLCERIKEDTLNCLTGDDFGCLDPEELDDSNCELLWLKKQLTLTPSDFEQLTRLREAAEKALRLIGKGRGHIGWCRHRHQQINDRDSNASLDEWLKDRTQVEDALREALAQRNTGGK